MRSIDKDKLIQSIELFDTYTGKGIPEGQKSLSFRLELRHKDRTLTDTEFQILQKDVFAALEKTGGSIRGRS